MWRAVLSARLGFVLFMIAGMTLFGLRDPGYTYDPTLMLRNIYGAPHAVLTIYEVAPGMDAQFLDAMVKAGPYNNALSGFANERILQSLPLSEGKTRLFFSIGRYYDLGTAEFIESQRNSTVRPFLVRDQLRLDASLVEYLLADWGWEKGTQHLVVRAQAFKTNEIFQKNLSALSFFKSGYVGQVGMLEVFPEGTSLDQVRAKVGERHGLYGASIVSTRVAAGYAVYSEYFSTPRNLAEYTFMIPPVGGLPLGGQAGIVVQNYIPR